jgi:hypothetical protein
MFEVQDGLKIERGKDEMHEKIVYIGKNGISRSLEH